MNQAAEAGERPARRRLTTVEETDDASRTTTLYTIIDSPNPFRERWYPVAPIADLPRGRPYGIELFNTPLVVFWDAQHERWRCLLDRCKHRAVSLSCGKLRKDGSLRCLYHGWTYDGDGRCIDIPSVAGFKPQEKLKVDHFAVHEHARILWVFAGHPEQANPGALPELPWQDPSYYACLFVRDTEFDWLVYNEHNLDRDHLQFAHPKTLGHMPPAKAFPERVKNGALESGLFYRQAVGKGAATQEARSAFFPPSTTLASVQTEGKSVGISFTVSPLGYGRCRVIFLLYASKRIPVPDFMFHLTFARVTEEDAVLIRSQMAHLAQGDLHPDELFANVGQDIVVRDYRAWLRSTGGTFWQRELNQRVRGERAPQARTLAPESASLYRKWEGQMHLANRQEQHFRICRTCQRAYRGFAVARVAAALLVALLCIAAFRADSAVWLLVAAVLPTGLGLVADHFLRVLKGRRF